MVGATDITDIAASGTADTLADNVRIINATADLTLNGLVLTGGVVTGHGGAVNSSGGITLIGSTVAGNRANGDGGGVKAAGVTLIGSIVSDNVAYVGGGIRADDVNLTNSTVSRNAAIGDGSFSASTGVGGGFEATHTATLLDSTVSDNSAISGGGFSTINSTVTNSTISGNHASIGGGGILGTIVDLINATVSGNHADNSIGGISGFIISLDHSTVSGNSAGFATGGIGAAGVNLFNSIVLGNTATTNAEINGTIGASGVNIVGVGGDTDASDGLINASSVGAVFAVVDGTTGGGLLADNGGPVKTIALKLDVTNPAIDAGVDSNAFIADARGLVRVDYPGAAHNGAEISDLGAFEANGVDPFIVTTLDDVVDAAYGLISLREAIGYAQIIDGEDTITFDPSLAGGTIRLASKIEIGDVLIIDGDIDGDGDADITISGDQNGDDVTTVGDITDIALSDTADTLNDNVRIFNTSADLTLNGLVLTGGVASGSGESGGAVRGNGSGTDVTLSNVILSGNSADLDGAGVAAAGIVRVIASTVSGNIGSFRGGGIFSNQAAEITGSTFTGNFAAYGGAVFVFGTATLVNATLSGNDADEDGGGLYADFASVTNSTVTGNSADDDSGGIRVGGAMTLTNSIVLGNSAPSGTDISGMVSKTGGNIVGGDVFHGETDVGNTTAAAVFASTVDIGGGVMAGVLADNGGKVQTIGLKRDAANPALDRSNTTAPALDARGEARVDRLGIANHNGSAADLGAFELESLAPAISSNGGGDAALVAVAENGVMVATVAAADPDGDPPVYSITGGADAALFQIDPATGALAFKAGPDFEAPQDADGDNVYDVIVRASDGALSDTQSLTVTVIDVAGVKIVGTAADDMIDLTQSVAGQPLPGDEADTIAGRGGDDRIAAGAGDDVVKGGGGDDRLDGGAGDDMLLGGKGRNRFTGGEGDDAFVITRKGSFARIADYEAGEVIELAAKAFHGIGPKGVLKAKFFHAGAEAETENQRILYDDESGKMLYARHGSDTDNPRAFARIGKGLDLDHADVLVI